MKRKLRKWVFGVFIVIYFAMFLALFLALFLFGRTNYYKSYEKEVLYSLQTFDSYHEDKIVIDRIYLDCKNESKYQYVICISDTIKRNHTYRVNEGAVSLEVLFSEGADCEGWSWFWTQILKRDGWETQIVVQNRHAQVVASKDTTFCVLDQENYNCLEANT